MARSRHAESKADASVVAPQRADAACDGAGAARLRDGRIVAMAALFGTGGLAVISFSTDRW